MAFQPGGVRACHEIGRYSAGGVGAPNNGRADGAAEVCALTHAQDRPSSAASSRAVQSGSALRRTELAGDVTARVRLHRRTAREAALVPLSSRISKLPPLVDRAFRWKERCTILGASSWLRSGLVDAALQGFDRGEPVSLPPLHDVALWDAYEGARKAMAPRLSSNESVTRYQPLR